MQLNYRMEIVARLKASTQPRAPLPQLTDELTDACRHERTAQLTIINTRFSQTNIYHCHRNQNHNAGGNIYEYIRNLSPRDRLLQEYLGQLKKRQRQREVAQEIYQWLEKAGLMDNTAGARTGPRHQIHGGRSLPQLTGPKLLAVQRCFGDIERIIVEFKIQAGTVYRNVCVTYGLEVPKS